jgi:C_GCAxxG_C_C family probable redox protein
MTAVDVSLKSFGEGFNCAQSVLTAFSERYGVEPAAACRMAEGFGGGMAGLGKTCGAVTGAMLVIGLACGRTKADDAAAKMVASVKVRRLIAKFEALHGSVACRDLLGCEIDTPEKLQIARDKALIMTRCSVFVRSASEIVEELLGA